MGEDAFARRFEHERPDHAERVPRLTIGRHVAHAIAVQGRLVFADERPASLPALEEPGSFGVMPVGQFYPDDVVRAARQEGHTLLLGDDVVRRADDDVHGADNRHAGAQASKRQ